MQVPHSLGRETTAQAYSAQGEGAATTQLLGHQPRSIRIDPELLAVPLLRLRQNTRGPPTHQFCGLPPPAAARIRDQAPDGAQ